MAVSPVEDIPAPQRFRPLVSSADVKLNARIETLLALALLGLLVIGCILVLLPFASALIWACVLCFSTWGLYLRVLRALNGRKGVAAAVMALFQATIIVLPVLIVASGLADHAEVMERTLRRLAYQTPAEPPAWVQGLPFVGAQLAERWSSLASDSGELVELLRQQIAPMTRALLDAGLAFGGGLLYLLLSVLTSFFLYRDGAFAAEELRAALARIGGDQAERMLSLAANTVRSVVYGLIGTALAQASLAALGFWVAGVPGPIFLGLLTFFSSPLPFGPPLVWGAASLWLYGEGASWPAVGLALWGLLFVSTIDNVIKPIIIGHGSRLPFMLVLLGVIGGVISFGVIGVFLGPTLLALGYNLLREWTENSRRPVDPEHA